MSRFYVTTAIPYVNGDPHVGFALELVQADVLARHRRLRGNDVRFLTGTDDNALKNVKAAEAEEISVRELVDRNAARFAELREPLQLSFDDFIRTSADPRHRAGVERLWRACAAAGDLYLRDYEGLYCGGCEAFLGADELDDGCCPEHGVAPERVAERNWFFRLSRYETELIKLVESGRLRIDPEQRRNEVLGFLRGGLADFSVSRSRERARGWGIPVPDDPAQVIYVWFDALGNYVTALEGDLYADWWEGSDERLHVIGKGILRFHAVYWPAILLSAGLPLPTTIFVHDYLTAGGRKLGKSLGDAAEPGRLVRLLGSDALRWWLLRAVPRTGDTDFREELVAGLANTELANGLGNLVSRTVALATTTRRVEAAELRFDDLQAKIDEALARFDFRAATGALWEAVVEANRFVEQTRPWELQGAERDAAVSSLVAACETVAHQLQPFLPLAAERISKALRTVDPAAARRLFPRLELAA